MNKFFNFKHLKGDLFGGITAGIVALPLALAFGVSSGLGPSAGLYGAIFIGFFAALFGGTNTQISGPTAPMTAISMVIVGGIVAANDGDVGRALPIILTIFLLVGIIQILLGVLGFGKYIKYIPYPVVSGFMTAIGVIIIITQIIPSLGYYPKDDGTFVDQFKGRAEEAIFRNLLKDEAGNNVYVIQDYQETLKNAERVTPEQILKESQSLAAKESSGVVGSIKVLPRALANINWMELALAAGTIFIIFAFKRVTMKVPSTLVALLVMSGIAVGFNLDYRPIDAIPSGIPLPVFEIFSKFSLGNITPYIFTAISLALLGSIDSLLTSVVADNMTKTKHNPNQELIGQGIGNSVAGIFGGLPGAGATIRTVVNINAGGKTRLSGMIASMLILLILLALAPIASKIPAAVLAGILITVGIGVMDYKGLKAIGSMPVSEVVIMITVLLLSTFWNLVYAVGIGLVIASLMFMKKIGDISAKSSEVNALSEDEVWADEFDFPEQLKEEVYIKHLSGPLFFGSTTDFQNMSNQIPSLASTVIIRMGRVPYIDQSGLYAIDDVLANLKREGKRVLLTGVRTQPKYMFDKLNIVPGMVPVDHVFEHFRECLQWVKENVKDEYDSPQKDDHI